MDSISCDMKSRNLDTDANKESLNYPHSSSSCELSSCSDSQRKPLRKARYFWQIKNRRKRRKLVSSFHEKDSQSKLISSAHSSKCLQSIDDANDIIDSQPSKSCLKVMFKAKFEDSDSMDENSSATKIDLKVFEPQQVWSQSRGSPVGIILKSMDEVATLAQKQDNLLRNRNPHLLKFYMKGIAENSVNKILEATGTAPGGKPSRKYLVNQEELEDEAVSEVIRQHGIHPPCYSTQNIKYSKCKDEEQLCDDDLNSESISSNQDNTAKTNMLESEDDIYAECQMNLASECINVSQADLFDAAVFSAISDKGLSTIPM